MIVLVTAAGKVRVMMMVMMMTYWGMTQPQQNDCVGYCSWQGKGDDDDDDDDDLLGDDSASTK